MQNDDKKIAAMNETTNAASGNPEHRRSRCKNADNDDLGPWEEFGIGRVPEVNGEWAIEMSEFLPTTGELLVIAEHWAEVAIERTFIEWANATNTDDWRRIFFAWRRVYRIRGLIGEIVDRVIEDKIKKFYEEDGRRWDPARWKNFSLKIDREAQKRHLRPVISEFEPPF
jgi:hypothetical protein